MKFFGKLKQAITGRSSSGSLLPAHVTATGEPKAVSFLDALTAYSRDPSCKAFVDFLADQAVGMGFYTTANPEYRHAEKAKQAVDEFNEYLNLDEMLQNTVREIVATGNSFWQKKTPQKLEAIKHLPLVGFDHKDAIQRHPKTLEVKKISYKYFDAEEKFLPSEIIHWRWNPIACSAFGAGVLDVLLAELAFDGGKRMSFLEMKARIEKAMPEIFEKYAGPDQLWIFPTRDDKKLAKYARIIETKPKAGARFVSGDKNADVKSVSVDPRARYEAYIDHILNQIYLGGQTPIPKLLTTPGFTEASANAAIEVAERHVLSLQRFIKRTIEHEIFVPIIAQNGLDPKAAECRLNWGMPEKPDINEMLPLLANIAKDRPDIITAQEFRKILTDMGLPLETATQQHILP